MLGRDGVLGRPEAGEPGTGANFVLRASEEIEALYRLCVEPRRLLPVRVRRLVSESPLDVDDDKDPTELVDDDDDKGRLGVNGRRLVRAILLAGVLGTDMLLVVVLRDGCRGKMAESRIPTDAPHHVVAWPFRRHLPASHQRNVSITPSRVEISSCLTRFSEGFFTQNFIVLLLLRALPRLRAVNCPSFQCVQ